MDASNFGPLHVRPSTHLALRTFYAYAGHEIGIADLVVCHDFFVRNLGHKKQFLFFKIN